MPSWSRDGKWIYFASNRSGAWQVWRAPSEGGGPEEQVTRLGGFAAFESEDGQYLYYAKGRSAAGFGASGCRTATKEAFVPELRTGLLGLLDAGCQAALFPRLGRARQAGRIWWQPFSGSGRSVGTVEGTPAVADSGLALSPDRRYLSTRKSIPAGSDILLLENYRER